MENIEPHINVFPKIKSNIRNVNLASLDPDVESVLNSKMSKKNLDILKMKHEPTEEEQINDTSKQVESPYSWLIITLAIVIIVLIIGIAWYVLKANEDCVQPPNIPNNIIQPNMIQPNMMQPNMMQPNNIIQYPQMRQHPAQNFSHPLHPNNRPQTENLPIQTKSMNTQQNKQPTKKELIATLNKLELDPIIEEVVVSTNNANEKTINPNKKNNSLSESQLTTERENDGADEADAQDSELATTFYNNLQQNIDNDNADDEND
jgi:hypothetical protein